MPGAPIIRANLRKEFTDSPHLQQLTILSFLSMSTNFKKLSRKKPQWPAGVGSGYRTSTSEASFASAICQPVSLSAGDRPRGSPSCVAMSAVPPFAGILALILPAQRPQAAGRCSRATSARWQRYRVSGHAQRNTKCLLMTQSGYRGTTSGRKSVARCLFCYGLACQKRASSFLAARPRFR
jgi:hypothetical protein